MSTAARFSGVEARRSTRIDHTIPLIIVGQTKLGLSFQERTSAVSVNLHGCRYPSRHDYSVGSWVGLQVIHPTNDGPAQIVRAQVRSIHPPMSPRELYQIGVEFEAPGNIWSIPAPPEDWRRMLEGSGMKNSGTASAPEPLTMDDRMAKLPASPEYRSAGVTAFPAPPAPLEKPDAREPAPAKPERVVITSDQLISAVQGKLQLAAEKAVHNAINTHLMEAVRSAVNKIDEVCKANVTQIENFSTERLEAMIQSAKADTVARVDTRLGEHETRLEMERAVLREQAQEAILRLEAMTSDARQELADALEASTSNRVMEPGADTRIQETTQKLESMMDSLQRQFNEIRELAEGVRGAEPQIRGRLMESVARASEDFDTAATRVADRQLVRLIEDKQMVTREAAAQLAACSAEMRAQLQSTANSTLDEFRRQMEVQVDLTISEATQRLMSSLASLDAENRAACEARRQAIESDVARATEQSTDQFRTGIKAFLYSCLVAAVGAVDEHAKTTLDSLASDQKRSFHELGSGPGQNSPSSDLPHD